MPVITNKQSNPCFEFKNKHMHVLKHSQEVKAESRVQELKIQE
jgi:aminopeptidase-like protein